jgi:hypothetical protein
MNTSLKAVVGGELRMGPSSVAVIQSRRLVRDRDSKFFHLASRQSFCQKHSSLTKAFSQDTTNVFFLILFLYKIKCS